MNKKEAARRISIERISGAALKLFVRYGYVNTTIDDIADACRLTKGAIYHYFASKEDLLLYLLNEIARESDDTLKRAETPGGSPSNKLVNLLHTHAKHAVEHPDNFLLLVLTSLEFAHAAPRIRDRVSAIFDKIRNAVEAIIREGRRAHKIASPMSDSDFARYFLAAYCGNVVEWQRSRRNPAIGRALVRALRIALLSSLNLVETGQR
jgi:AcrR family transcriptional regulator